MKKADLRKGMRIPVCQVRKALECRHFGRCGGCQIQHMAYDEQIRIKERNIVDAIERIGG